MDGRGLVALVEWWVCETVGGVSAVWGLRGGRGSVDGVIEKSGGPCIELHASIFESYNITVTKLICRLFPLPLSLSPIQMPYLTCTCIWSNTNIPSLTPPSLQ